jgi:DNA-directed RNA polymerase beta subunit
VYTIHGIYLKGIWESHLLVKLRTSQKKTEEMVSNKGRWFNQTFRMMKIPYFNDPNTFIVNGRLAYQVGGKRN